MQQMKMKKPKPLYQLKKKLNSLSTQKYSANLKAGYFYVDYSVSAVKFKVAFLILNVAFLQLIMCALLHFWYLLKWQRLQMLNFPFGIALAILISDGMVQYLNIMLRSCL
jgi:hypothetical protein